MKDLRIAFLTVKSSILIDLNGWTCMCIYPKLTSWSHESSILVGDINVNMIFFGKPGLPTPNESDFVTSLHVTRQPPKLASTTLVSYTNPVLTTITPALMTSKAKTKKTATVGGLILPVLPHFD